MTLEAFWKAMCDAFANRRRNAKGDYSPAPTADRFPVWSSQRDTVPFASRVSLTKLVSSWWEEAEATGSKVSTHEQD
jgi:hypothetical protein